MWLHHGRGHRAPPVRRRPDPPVVRARLAERFSLAAGRDAGRRRALPGPRELALPGGCRGRTKSVTSPILLAQATTEFFGPRRAAGGDVRSGSVKRAASAVGGGSIADRKSTRLKSSH